MASSLYYNFAITPWLKLTPDLQIVRGAQKDQRTIGQGPLGVPFIANRKSISTATTLGLRLQMVSRKCRGSGVEGEFEID
jgi:hypothetical protein